MASRRVERVSSLLKQAIGRVIVSELSDPRMGFVTVVRVDPSPDLRTAKVFVSVLGEPAVTTRTLAGLKHAARFIKRRVSDEVDLRSVPELTFVEDQSVKGTARVSRIIADAMSEARPASAETGGPDAESEEKSPDLSDEELEKLLEERKAEEAPAEDESEADDEDDDEEEEEDELDDDDEDDLIDDEDDDEDDEDDEDR